MLCNNLRSRWFWWTLDWIHPLKGILHCRGKRIELLNMWNIRTRQQEVLHHSFVRLLQYSISVSFRLAFTNHRQRQVPKGTRFHPIQTRSTRGLGHSQGLMNYCQSNKKAVSFRLPRTNHRQQTWTRLQAFHSNQIHPRYMHQQEHWPRTNLPT